MHAVVEELTQPSVLPAAFIGRQSSDTSPLFVSCGCKHADASVNVTNLCCAGGFAFGYWASRIAGLPEKAARTNSIEVRSLLHCVTFCRHLLFAGKVLPMDSPSASC